MPASQRRQRTLPTTSAASRSNNAKYTNKDGTKFITVPQIASSITSPEPSPSMTQTTTKVNGQPPIPSPETNGTPPQAQVNRKKQKRREKQAARLAAEQPVQLSPGAADKARGESRRQDDEDRAHQNRFQGPYREQLQSEPPEGDYFTDENEGAYSGSGGYDGAQMNGSASKKSRKKHDLKTLHAIHTNHMRQTNGPSLNRLSLPLHQMAVAPTEKGSGISKEKIWNTSSQEERERIKQFWLSLGEKERKSLVKVEKDAVLKKMKEQQRMSCSCTVCGRKRVAIEEELEVLYDAYYDELETYANRGGGVHMRPLGHLSGMHDPKTLPSRSVFNGRQQPLHAEVIDSQPPGDEEEYDEDDEEEEDGDEVYSDGDEEEYSEEEPEELEQLPRSHAAEFFSFGQSLTVQGGILTVADDLLKNDGKKFIEMMEQLAERRMARDGDSKPDSFPNYAPPAHASIHPMHAHQGHSHSQHPPADDDEYDDEDDDEEDDYDSQEDSYEEEEMDSMTEEQRMEEGRRMFQIFAARMFEQRVLQAYKEKVAEERQIKLMEELKAEDEAGLERKKKKAEDAKKKKEKAMLKKQAIAEEKAQREAAKAAEEAGLREQEQKRQEEQRLKQEEKRKKKDAQKKAEDEERARKEAEKLRRANENRERQAELERKAREIKEKEKKEKEDLRRQQVEAKEAKEREARERRERQEQDKRDKEARAKADREAKELQKREEQAAQLAAVQAAYTASRRPQPPMPTPSSIQSSAVASPRVPVALPAAPKAPTPMKIRTGSQQGPIGSFPQTPLSFGQSQNTSPNSSTPLHDSPGPTGPPGRPQQPHPFLHQPQASSPMHAAIKPPPGMSSPFAGMQPMSMGFQPGMPMMGPGYGGRMPFDAPFPHQPPMSGAFRPMPLPNGMPLHPGLNMHSVHQGRGFPLQHPPGFGPPAGLGQPFGIPEKTAPSSSHSRQQSSTSHDMSITEGHAQPIARPAPIGRPSSVVHGMHRNDSMKNDMDELTNHLGSSALLDDSDEPIISGMSTRRASVAPGNLPRQNFAPYSMGMDPTTFGGPMSSYNTWGSAPQHPFGTSSLPGTNYMGWGSNTFSHGNSGPTQPVRASQPRSVAVRLMICRAYRLLGPSTLDGYIGIDTVRIMVEEMNVPGDQPVSEKEILDICETEGNTVNGGGSFDIRPDGNGRPSIRFENDAPPSNHRSVGEIGSPIVGAGGERRGFPGPPPGF